MNKLLEEILLNRKTFTGAGEEITLDAAIDKEEADFISSLIKNNKLSIAVEVGCAMGLSSLAIADALHEVNGQYRHYIIDPFQSTQWKNTGITNLQRAGFRNHELIEKGSEYGLPELCQRGVKVDFGFIDGWHTFDHTLIDFFYINRMLKVGGVVVIDDVHMPGINKCMRYIFNYPCYEYCGHVPVSESTAGRKMLDATRRVASAGKYVFGKRLFTELFSAEAVRSNNELHLYSSMIAFRKIKEDDRPWNWYKSF